MPPDYTRTFLPNCKPNFPERDELPVPDCGFPVAGVDYSSQMLAR